MRRDGYGMLLHIGVGELPALLRGLLTVALVECGLRCMALPRLARLLGTPLSLESSMSDKSARQTPSDLTLPARSIRRIAAARRVLRHWPFGDTCLRQALVIGHLLRGLGPTLHIGVAKVEDQVRAHAWIMVEGTMIDPLRAASSYLTLQASDGGVL